MTFLKNKNLFYSELCWFVWKITIINECVSDVHTHKSELTQTRPSQSRACVCV